MAPQFLVIDTTAETIRGAGGIDLREEKYNLRLSASSKKASILALRGPILAGGTLKSPPVVGPELHRAHPQRRPAPPPDWRRSPAARAGRFALIDPGGARSDVDCASLLSGDQTIRRSVDCVQGVASASYRASWRPAAADWYLPRRARFASARKVIVIKGLRCSHPSQLA